MFSFRRLTILISVLLIAVGAAWWVGRFHKDSAPDHPVTHDGAKWRIAYYEGGPFFNYTDHLRALVKGLITLGWMEALTIPPFEPSDDSRLVWDFLAQQTQSDYIEFVSDAYWSAGWDTTQRAINRAEAIRRLAEGHDLDLIIAMGTWAGLDLANNEHAVPTLVMSTSNPIQAGIIKSATDSGYDHVHAWCDPDQYVRQVRLFHDIVKFKRVGAVYENTPDGRTYANLDELQRVARERHFEVKLCEAPDINLSVDEARQAAFDCFEQLAPVVDAMWINGAHRGIVTEFMPQILAPFFEYHVPTWSQVGEEQVRRGVLLSITHKNFDAQGLWTAKVVGRIFNGTKPRAIGQVYERPADIVLNLETARRIGFHPPEGIVKAADLTFNTIEGE